MTQEEIIEMAINSGLPSKEAAQHNLWWLEAFAKLVDAKATAKEREACWEIACEYTQLFLSHPCLAAADAIRARGEA